VSLVYVCCAATTVSVLSHSLGKGIYLSRHSARAHFIILAIVVYCSWSGCMIFSIVLFCITCEEVSLSYQLNTTRGASLIELMVGSSWVAVPWQPLEQELHELFFGGWRGASEVTFQLTSNQCCQWCGRSTYTSFACINGDQ
jgi:hypothetical protein